MSNPHRPSAPTGPLALLVVAVLVLLAASCGSDDTTTTAGSVDPAPADTDAAVAAGGATRPWLAGDWVLQSASGPDGPLTFPDGVTPELSIAGPDAIEGVGVCNSFGGTISAPFDGDEAAGPLTISEVFSTEIGCDGLDAEQAYFALLTAATEWELAPPAGLVFRGDGIELVYEIAQPPAEVPLEQTVWTFDTVFEGEGVERTASTPRLDKATVTAVVGDGMLTLSADDCGSLTVAVDHEGDQDGSFAVTDPASAVADCDDPESNLELALAGILDASGYQIIDGRLTLIGFEGETVSFAAADG